jgi:hypothetical protein
VAGEERGREKEMSYTEVFSFDKNGDATGYSDIRNSWRGAPAIWRYLEEKHPPPYRPSYVPSYISDDDLETYCHFKPTRSSSMKVEDMKEIWELAENEKIPLHERIVLYTTFDKCLVKKEDLQKVIDAFNQFEAETSLKEQAEVLTKLLNDNDCIAVGWNQTSVNGDTWACYGYDEEKDESVPYNCLAQNEHYWLFDELEK